MLHARSLLSLTLKASGAVAEGRCITLAGVQATVAGAKVRGVTQYAANDGQGFAATVAGTALVEAGAAIAVGDSLICDAQGRAIPASGALVLSAGAVAVTSSAANGAVLEGAELPEFVFADALEAATAAGKFIEVLLR